MHVGEMGKTKERKVRMLIHQDWHDSSIHVPTSCSFDYLALVVLETLSCLGFLVFWVLETTRGLRFRDTPLTAFEVN